MALYKCVYYYYYYSQPQSITTPWPVPSYAAWRQRHEGVHNLPKVVTTYEALPVQDFNPQPANHKSNTLPVTPLHITMKVIIISNHTMLKAQLSLGSSLCSMAQYYHTVTAKMKTIYQHCMSYSIIFFKTTVWYAIHNGNYP